MRNVVRTFWVAFWVCFVCSIFVSTTAVYLKPRYESNKKKEMQKNIIAASLLSDTDQKTDELFSKIKDAIVDFKTGQVFFDIKNNEEILVPADKDVAGIKRHPRYGKIYYLLYGTKLNRLILPIYGKGLWSTMYALLTLGHDLNTIESIIFYEHGETPGLGGEIENPKWQSKWKGKKLYSQDGSYKFEVIKGRVTPFHLNAIHEVDGLSGATLTTKGVSNLVKYWLSDNGYGKFLNNLKEGKIILR